MEGAFSCYLIVGNGYFNRNELTRTKVAELQYITIIVGYCLECADYDKYIFSENKQITRKCGKFSLIVLGGIDLVFPIKVIRPKMESDVTTMLVYTFPEL